MLLVVTMIVSSGLFAGGYYLLHRSRINKKLKELQRSTYCNDQLDALKDQPSSADLEQQKLQIEVRDESNSSSDNPFVSAQKKRHKHFRSSQSSHSDEESK